LLLLLTYTLFHPLAVTAAVFPTEKNFRKGIVNIPSKPPVSSRPNHLFQDRSISLSRFTLSHPSPDFRVGSLIPAILRSLLLFFETAPVEQKGADMDLLRRCDSSMHPLL